MKKTDKYLDLSQKLRREEVDLNLSIAIIRFFSVFNLRTYYYPSRIITNVWLSKLNDSLYKIVQYFFDTQQEVGFYFSQIRSTTDIFCSTLSLYLTRILSCEHKGIAIFYWALLPELRIRIHFLAPGSRSTFFRLYQSFRKGQIRMCPN